MRVTSVNVGSIRPLLIGNGQTVKSAILKRPASGFIEVGSLGLVGDQIGEPQHHGGEGQAVYAYSTQDYAYWESALGIALPPATFGENLTVDGFLSTECNVGDEWGFPGGLRLQVTCPRIPCNKLTAVMGRLTGSDQAFAPIFANARRPGVYLRVLQTGPIGAGDEIVVTPLGDNDPVSVIELMDAYYDPRYPADRIRHILAAPIDPRGRAMFTDRLERGR